VWSSPWGSSGCDANVTGNISNTSPLTIGGNFGGNYLYEILVWKGAELSYV
jgi:hypothetical protein